MVRRILFSYLFSYFLLSSKPRKMSVEIQINIKDDAGPYLKKLVASADPHVLSTKIAPRLASYWRDHLISLPRNKRGFPSTGFWEDAARRVRGLAIGSNCLLQCDKLGLRQRLKGGTIKAINVKNLAIPLTSESYGTSPADWGDTLTLVILGDGRKFLCLYTKGATEKAYKSTIGKFQTQFSKRKSEGKIQARAAERSTRSVRQFASSVGGEDHPRVIMFRQGGGNTKARAERHGDLKFLFKLQPSVEQGPNPDVIPSDISEVAKEEVVKALV
jgi:hypothetical protein